MQVVNHPKGNARRQIVPRVKINGKKSAVGPDRGLVAGRGTPKSERLGISVFSVSWYIIVTIIPIINIDFCWESHFTQQITEPSQFSIYPCCLSQRNLTANLWWKFSSFLKISITMYSEFRLLRDFPSPVFEKGYFYNFRINYLCVCIRYENMTSFQSKWSLNMSVKF